MPGLSRETGNGEKIVGKRGSVRRGKEPFGGRRWRNFLAFAGRRDSFVAGNRDESDSGGEARRGGNPSLDLRYVFWLYFVGSLLEVFKVVLLNQLLY